MGEGSARSMRDYQREASDARQGLSQGIGIWPPEALESERRFGQRVARLYPFLHDPKRWTNVGAVRAGGRVGTLHQAFSSGCLVELMAERRFVKGDPKQGPIMRQNSSTLTFAWEQETGEVFSLAVNGAVIAALEMTTSREEQDEEVLTLIDQAKARDAESKE